MAVTRDGIPVRCWTLPRQHRRHRDHPHRQGRPGRVGAAPAGVGGRPRVRLRRQPGLPDPRRRALHPRREAAPHQHRGRRGAGPPGPLPHRRRQPAGQGGLGAPAKDGGRRRRPHPAVRDLPQPRAGRARPAGPHQPRRAPAAAHRRLRCLDHAAPRRTRRILKTKPGLRRYLRRTKTGLLRVDQAAIHREAHLDGKWLLRTSDLTLTPDDLAAAYKQLLAVERGWRDFKGALRAAPGVPPPRGPHPRPHPAVLAGAAAASA